MVDLYATFFYKVRFTIEAKDKDTDLLWRIILHIRDWMTNKHNINGTVDLPEALHSWTALKQRSGGEIVGETVRVVSENCFVEEPFPASFWACRILESPKPRRGYAPRRWTTEIGVEPVEPGVVTFSCIISYNDRPGFVGECGKVPSPSVPKVVLRLWEDEALLCRNGADEPSVVPTKLRPGDFMGFWERVRDRDRELPYLYLSPCRGAENEGAVLLDPEKLAIALGGNALVFYADDPGVTGEMNYCCPDSYKCYGGALRIYYPQLDETQPQDAYRHRFLSGDAIRSAGEDHIVQMLRRAIAQDASSFDRIFRIENCREKRSAIIRRKRLEELKEQHREEMQSQQDQTMEMAIREEEKRLEAEENAALLELENEDLRAENYRLTAENDSYRSLAKENADLRRACASRLAIRAYPDSAESLVQYFDAVFGDRLAFSEEARKSLKDCRIPLEDLWHAFFSLAAIMRDLYLHGTGDIFKAFREQSGIDAGRGEGMMTRQNRRLMRQYETEYQGETIDIEAHITYPRIRQSIHFGFSDREQKVVVGWCGAHKENHSTRNIH